MKHNLKINTLLISLFIISQIIGLAVINNYIDHEATSETKNMTYSQLPLNLQTPQQEQDTAVILMMGGILLATGLVFLLFKFKLMGLWKLWFGLAVFIALSISLNVIFAESIAILVALGLAIYKILRPNFFIHNLTEILIYGGIAAIFVPLLNLTSAFILLIAISIYDIIAVNKSKHMVKLANMQRKQKTFAGLNIPYISGKNIRVMPSINKRSKKRRKKKKVKSAILGGGDIVFPLLFSGVVFKELILVIPITEAILKTLIITLFSTFALIYLLVKSEKDKFYPAMPYLSAGCFIGYLAIILIP